MKVKSFIVGFGSFTISTAFLYLLGSIFTIPLLMFQYEYTNNEREFFLSVGALTPIIIGLVVSFIAEKIYRRNYQQKLG